MLAQHARVFSGAAPLTADVNTRRLGDYHGYAELVQRWCELERAGARVERIGTSAAGEPLFCVDLGPADAARASVVMAGIHPMEWIGVESGLALLERLVAAPPPDRRIVAFPLVNVDGYRQVERDLRAGHWRFVRTNTRGVDLNRNWRVHFRKRRRLAGVLFGWNYGGPQPTSEPEIEAVVGKLDDVAATATIDAAVSLHSFGRMILVPYGGTLARAPRYAELARAAEAVQRRLRFRYRIGQSSRWVPGVKVCGMELDHLHDEYGAIALLIECSRGGARLRDPASWLHPFRWYNPPRPRDEAGAIADALVPFVNPPG